MGTWVTRARVTPSRRAMSAWLATLPVSSWRFHSLALRRALNTTRGKALHAIMQYALWVRRTIEQDPNSKERINNGFRDEALRKVADVLERHLNEEKAVCMWAVYGQWFPWLVMLDSGWAQSHKAEMFPQGKKREDLKRWQAAWNAYVLYCPMYDNVFRLLTDEYLLAVKRLGDSTKERVEPTDPEAKLADHLMVAYWRGLAPREGALLRLFYEKAPVTLRRHVFTTVGQSLRNAKEAVPGDMKGRLQELVEWRAATITSGTPDVEELTSFGWWFVSGPLDRDWVLPMLKQVLRLTHKIEPDHLVLDRLAEVARETPRDAVECLGMMVRSIGSERISPASREAIKVVLSSGITHGDEETRDATKVVINAFGECGGWDDLADLLKRGSCGAL